MKLPSLENVFFNSADVDVAVAVDLICEEIYQYKKNIINTNKIIIINQKHRKMKYYLCDPGDDFPLKPHLFLRLPIGKAFCCRGPATAVLLLDDTGN